MKQETHKIIDKDVLIETEDGRILTTSVVLSIVRGGRQIRYIDKDGNILKKEKYSQSSYSKSPTK